MKKVRPHCLRTKWQPRRAAWHCSPCHARAARAAGWSGAATVDVGTAAAQVYDAQSCRQGILVLPLISTPCCRAALSRTLDSRSLYLSARRPISVVHTGVKSAGWLNRMAHLPSIHSCLQQEALMWVQAGTSGISLKTSGCTCAVLRGSAWSHATAYSRRAVDAVGAHSVCSNWDGPERRAHQLISPMVVMAWKSGTTLPKRNTPSELVSGYSLA